MTLILSAKTLFAFHAHWSTWSNDLPLITTILSKPHVFPSMLCDTLSGDEPRFAQFHRWWHKWVLTVVLKEPALSKRQTGRKDRIKIENQGFFFLRCTLDFVTIIKFLNLVWSVMINRPCFLPLRQVSQLALVACTACLILGMKVVFSCCLRNMIKEARYDMACSSLWIKVWF